MVLMPSAVFAPIACPISELAGIISCWPVEPHSPADNSLNGNKMVSMPLAEFKCTCTMPTEDCPSTENITTSLVLVVTPWICAAFAYMAPSSPSMQSIVWQCLPPMRRSWHSQSSGPRKSLIWLCTRSSRSDLSNTLVFKLWVACCFTCL